MKKFNKVSIIGVGLLGGSIGLAIKKQKLANEVVGFFRNKNKIKIAVKVGAVCRGTDNFKEAVKESDLIILCSTINDIKSKLRDLRKLGLNKTLITDTGSTKLEIIKAAKGLNFVGSHPLAGSEQSGVTFAKNNLFKNSICIVSSEIANATSKSQITKFWNSLGAKTIFMNAKKHDKILALTSHLPHAAAFSIIKSIPNEILKFSAGGLKDTTRIALSSPQVWLDVFISNKTNVLKAISALEKSLASLKSSLANSDDKELLSFLKTAQNKRRSIAQKP